MHREEELRKYSAAIALLCCSAAVLLAQRGPSTPEERERFVKIAHALEDSPSTADIKEREWAFKWLIEVPDISVKICAGGATEPLLKKKGKVSSDLLVQTTLSSAAFVIEHPEKASDLPAVQLAGIEGMLKMYEAIVKEKPKEHIRGIDDLLQQRAAGKLADVATKQAAGCHNESGKI